MMSGPGFRLARAAVFAAVCVVTAALGHAMMAGAPMPGWAVGYAFTGVTAGAWWLTGRERGAVTVTGATMVAQLALHGLFTLSQAVHGPVVPQPGMASMPGMTHGRAMGTAQVLHLDGRAWTAGMLLAHTAAAAVCGVWLWRGEAAVYRLGRALAAFVVAPLARARRVLAAAVPAAPARIRAAGAAALRLRRSPLRHSVVRRGPPGRPVCC